MTYRLRLVVFALAAAGVGTLLAFAFLRLPAFGSVSHPYGARALHAAWGRHTANAVASVTFDQRGVDTLVEELIFFASVTGAVVLLRPSEEESNRRAPRAQGVRVLAGTRVVTRALVPVTALIGCAVVAQGHLSPGGGFQGGVVVATALHLVYLGGERPSYGRLHGRAVYEAVEAVGAAAFVVLGLAGTVAAGTFLLNLLPTGTFGRLLSAGTVPLLNVAVGMEVASGVVVLLGRFYEQDAELRGRGTS